MKRITQKEFLAKVREIMASNENDGVKALLVRHEAGFYMDDAFPRFSECREIEARMAAIEDEHTGTSKRPTYCPECSTWSPAAPPKWDALCEEWTRAKKARTKKLADSVLGRKAA